MPSWELLMLRFNPTYLLNSKKVRTYAEPLHVGWALLTLLIAVVFKRVIA